MAEEMDIKKYVIFTGFMDDIRAVYACTDVAVLSSWSEGLRKLTAGAGVRGPCRCHAGRRGAGKW